LFATRQKLDIVHQEVKIEKGWRKKNLNILKKTTKTLRFGVSTLKKKIWSRLFLIDMKQNILAKKTEF
jgi:hypothetical protein